MESAVERVTPGDGAPSTSLVQTVSEILERGGLVALPTETVYGIAARADMPSALDALRDAKGRPAGMGFTWHVGDAGALDRFPTLSPMVRRLVGRYWPGPLTLVLPGVPEGLELVARDGWTGVRYPANALCAGIIAALKFPVVLSSANLHGAPPLADADLVYRALGRQLELIVDGGPARLGESSCVLRIGPAHFDLLRAGLFTYEQLRGVAGLRIGFVCTGNTCRSPMAEGFAKHVISERLHVRPAQITRFGFEVSSMGLYARNGDAAARNAIAVMKSEHINIGKHRARSAGAQDLAEFDRIYCMTQSHAAELTMSVPPGRAEHVQLLDSSGRDISDPMGGDLARYRAAADQIRACILERASEWV
jgi:tRNA threonylcarbamoyl adenosine modification protein (Sua5/YciO/YrdC/YwlC family)